MNLHIGNSVHVPAYLTRTEALKYIKQKAFNEVERACGEAYNKPRFIAFYFR